MSINRGMDKEDMARLYMEYYSARKRNRVMPFAETRMDRETVMQSEVHRKEKNTTYKCIYVASGKMVQMNLSEKQE